MKYEDVRELCKKIYLDNAETYFKTYRFDKWVDDCYKVHLECTKKERGKE